MVPVITYSWIAKPPLEAGAFQLSCAPAGATATFLEVGAVGTDFAKNAEELAEV
jgi:hypothetical protein